jgi:ankyrin repeat protein
MKPPPDPHRLILLDDLPSLKVVLDSPQQDGDLDLNGYDKGGYTPLMRAVMNPNASVDLVRLLLEHGAAVEMETSAKFMPSACVMALALGGGDPKIVALLLEHGANIHYKAGDNYGALLHAVHSRNVAKDDRLIDLLNLLIANGVELNSVSSYAESGLRVLSNLGRFDAVKVLLDAGADAAQLQWTPLLRAVALGSLAEVQKEVEQVASLEDKDWWQRTAWLLAIQTGDIAKARLLYERGANTGARGRCGKPSLFYAIENHCTPMLRWLLEIGAGVEEMDDFGTTPLWDAVESGNLEAVNDLLKAGSDLNHEKNGQTALSCAQTREIALRLLDAGADPQCLSFEGRRTLLALEPVPSSILFDARGASAGATRKGFRADFLRIWSGQASMRIKRRNYSVTASNRAIHLSGVHDASDNRSPSSLTGVSFRSGANTRITTTPISASTTMSSFTGAGKLILWLP